MRKKHNARTFLPNFHWLLKYPFAVITFTATNT